jgi:hypothetical protein
LPSLPAAAAILRRQLDILEIRIEAAIQALPVPIDPWDTLPEYLADVVRLDVETYYTVANDLLGVIRQLLPGESAAQFKKEPAYTRIKELRNHLARHRWDKSFGDPHPVFCFGLGFVARLGSGNPGKLTDRGYSENRAVLQEVLQRYAPWLQGLPDDARAWFLAQSRINSEMRPKSRSEITPPENLSK